MNWSSGPVEGRVNHIKMIKRQMFGRAGLLLLRKRALILRDEPSCEVADIRFYDRKCRR